MRIPARFLKYVASYSGQKSEEGWLEIDIRALDLEGVTKLYVNLDDVARLKTRREEAASTLGAWEAFLRGHGASEGESNDKKEEE